MNKLETEQFITGGDQGLLEDEEREAQVRSSKKKEEREKAKLLK